MHPKLHPNSDTEKKVSPACLGGDAPNHWRLEAEGKVVEEHTLKIESSVS